MEMREAVAALLALAQDSRLTIFRLLVAAGPDGLAAGRIAEAVGLAPATASFHLGQLRNAGLVSSRKAARSVVYVAEFRRMNALMAYLSENCCAGRADLCPEPLCDAVMCADVCAEEEETA